MPGTSTRRRHPLRRALPALLVVAWCGTIFWFSHQPDLTIASDDFVDFVTRKAAHVFVFGVLAVLLWSALRDTFGIRALRTRTIATVLLSLAWAISDEWHQTFVDGRVGHAQDVAIDMTGVAVALAALWWNLHRRGHLAPGTHPKESRR